MNDLYAQAQELFEYTRATRRDLHRNPEMGFKEFRTAGIIARELSQLGLEMTTGIAETGVVALLEGAHPGPVALVRFDMDALPVIEQTGAEYASLTSGVMHACGHDGHVSIGLTVAKLLSAWRDQIHGTVKLVFQPAEEGMGGAERMLDAGIMDDPKVDHTLALHIWNEKPLGWVAAVPGPLMAGADIFEARIEGKGGHGAMPQNTIDPVVAAAQIITALQTVVSRNIAPLDTAVVSVCQLHAGDAFNVIPQSAELRGTFRTFDAGVRQRVVERVEAIVTGLSEAMGCKAAVKITRLTPAVINDPAVAEIARQAAVETLPDAQIVTDYHTMVSEDMAYMMEKAPGCYLMIGSANAERGLTYGHHHPKFDFDEEVLPRAAALMTGTVLKLLK